MEPLTPSARSRIHRVPKRASYDRALVHAILDEGLVAHVGIAVDQQPYVIPMVYARLGDQLLLHGASASRLLKHGAVAPVCVTVTLVDGLVLARSAFHHSMNYRSVVILGQARRLDDAAEKAAALAAFVEHIARGRSAETRPPNPKELAATSVLALEISEASAKQRVGGPIDDEEDFVLPYWAGHLPLALRAGEAIADPQPPGAPVPSYLHGYARPAR